MNDFEKLFRGYLKIFHLVSLNLDFVSYRQPRNDLMRILINPGKIVRDYEYLVKQEVKKVDFKEKYG